MTIKNIKIFLLSLLAFALPCMAKAAEITAIDFNGNIIGQVISTGMVISPEGNAIGSISTDSLVLGPNGEIIGGVVPQGIVIGNDNHLLGKIHNDGVVRNLSGATLGKALPSGLIVDAEMNIIGSVLYPGLVYAPDGSTIGRVTGAGIYVNLEGQRVGFVSPNGYVYRKSGYDYVLDGRLMSSKMVVSMSGRFIGSIAPSGHVIDFEGVDIGSVHANGYVYDSSEKIIGGIVQSGYAYDNYGKYMGIVSYNGEVKLNNNTIGYYRADHNIVNDKNEVIGYAVDIAATANDNSGRFLGRLMPNGNIVRGMQVMGHLGSRGYVYDENEVKIGEIIHTGPVYDAFAKLRGQSIKNGKVISLSGSPIGSMRGSFAYDTNGTLMGGVVKSLVAVTQTNNSLGTVNIDAGVNNSGELNKVSPFGYLFDNSGKVVGSGLPMGALYSPEGILYSYINPNGDMYREISGVKLTDAGEAVGRDGYIGSILNPLFALNMKGESLGIFAENNLLLDAEKEIAYKIIPGDYVVESKKTISSALAPVRGFASDNRIALNIGGDLIGYADSRGMVIGLNGDEYGNIQYNDYVIDKSKNLAGQLIPFTTVYNEKCDVVGVVNGRGDIINNRDVIIGRLLPNGQAISDVGGFIGYSIFDKNLVDVNGNFAGVLSSGSGISADGRNLGCVNAKGRIYNADKKLVYSTVVNAPVIDFNNSIIGQVMTNGIIVDATNQTIGKMIPNKDVMSKDSRILGNVMQYKVAYSNANKFLGLVQNSGQVINPAGVVVGQVNFDGSVQNHGDVIGYALYDMYVYDEEFKTYGYLTKDGTVLSMVGSKLGQIDKGFLINRQREIVARGNRDYIVRNNTHDAIGELQLDGTVVSFNGENVGYLSDAGVIRNADGDEIAFARPLQYYVVTESSGQSSQDWLDRKRVKINDAEREDNEDYYEDDEGYETGKRSSGNYRKPNSGSRIVGIALSPDGDIIGNIYDDDTVRNDNGESIGFKTPDGMIVDMNYNPIGIEEVKHVSAENMFIPSNAFGNGNAYGIGEEPTNLGPGGGYGQGERYDPARLRGLRGLQGRRRATSSPGRIKNNINISSFTGYEKDGGWTSGSKTSTWRWDMSEMILEDKAIPAVLARSVYASEGFSDNIPITAIVERNVYAEEGRNIIIPAGSRVIGSMGGGGSSGGNSGGAVKIGIEWKRLIRPDGSQFRFSGAQTGDPQGRSGAIGYLDEQLLKKYSLPMVASLMESATAYLMAQGSGSSSDGNTTHTSSLSQAAEDARQNFLEQFDQFFDDLMQKRADIQAVTYIPAGTRIIIFPNEDLWLNSVERNNAGGGNQGGYQVESGHGLVSDNPGGSSTGPSGGSGGGNVQYSGNMQENVRPAQPATGGPRAGGGAPSAGAGAGTDTQTPPTVPSSNNSNDVPELL